MFSSSYLPRLKLTTRAAPKVIPCASSLREAGVKFKRKKKPDNMFHVTFEEGILELPSVLIDNSRKRLFLNLIAFEQSDRSTEKNLTSFATLMDMLINTPSDIEILEECDILHNMLPSAEEAASFFNQICECATLDYDDHYLAGLFYRVRDYCDSTWHRNRAKLVRDYFHNPWAILSFIAAIILLIFSFIQSFFSVFAYFRPPH
ncbi:hypothetical protein LUZ60_013757 [Juncus effusus]|nr:hypothetical protein LUZ60_013757 [Juncus effusus]